MRSLKAGHVLHDSDVVESVAGQKAVPHLHYEDPFAAVAWLCRAFELTEVKHFVRGGANWPRASNGPKGGFVMIWGHDER
jgi:hypothetical protein